MTDRQSIIDERMMQLALEEARAAFDAGEVPVGAVVVTDGRVIGRGHNLTECLGDVTAHAEMQAITAAASTLGGKYLTKCTLYVTVEPCLMCAGAIGWSQISRIVYGASDPKRGYGTYTDKPFHPRAEVRGGVMAEECGELMKRFFAKQRK
ncbi:MAG: nucleoside deaminase [Muribaculaceae bacterium]|nr:nucleoside deaminase [Muribaculaceae bacterium]